MDNFEHQNFELFFAEKLKSKGFSLKKLSEISGIALKHLENLQAGRYEQLPPAPYIRGYLMKLGGLLEFDGEMWWRALRAEGYVQGAGSADQLPDNRFARRPIRKSVWAGGAVLLVVFLYIVVRFSAIFGLPVVMLAVPSEESIIVNAVQPNFVLSGSLKNGSELLVNNDPVIINDDGSWEKEIILDPGLNTIEIRAEKFLGGERSLLRRIFYEPPAVTGMGTSPDASSFEKEEL